MCGIYVFVYMCYQQLSLSIHRKITSTSQIWYLMNDQIVPHLFATNGWSFNTHRYIVEAVGLTWQSAGPGLCSEKETGNCPLGKQLLLRHCTQDSHHEKYTVKNYKILKDLSYPDIISWHKNWEHSHSRNYR